MIASAIIEVFTTAYKIRNSIFHVVALISIQLNSTPHFFTY
jgi:hypothetical protein